MIIEKDSIMIICSCRHRGRDDGKVSCFIHHECGRKPCRHNSDLMDSVDVEYQIGDSNGQPK